jgi:diguanylate cyclase (GGDEF)-like protein
VHAWLAVGVLGWNSGFHYYIITLMMLSAFHPHWPARGKAAYSLLVCVAYLALNQWSLVRVPTIEIDSFTLDIVRWFNTVFTFGFVGYLAHYYAKAAREAECKLEQLASTDTLTGLYTRRQMLTVFKQEQSKLQRNQRPLSIIMIDIDNFKKLNDQFGHECGDDALKAIADCFRKTLRTQDHVARWGGEEFLILLPETNQAGALVLAEKVRELASHVPIITCGQTIHITITSAVGELHSGEDFNRCLARIDQGLLEGKRAGKNRVVRV